ncbi:hypothetical protein CC2G_014439 [Coprinopsis cinerea AmutBmut pab1-1]|nr:hypothetical protein CC2G_014439 [Coprinopsis cinerea AmutBmut pab1-1]
MRSTEIRAPPGFGGLTANALTPPANAAQANSATTPYDVGLDLDAMKRRVASSQLNRQISKWTTTELGLDVVIVKRYESGPNPFQTIVYRLTINHHPGTAVLYRYDKPEGPCVFLRSVAQGQPTWAYLIQLGKQARNRCRVRLERIVFELFVIQRDVSGQQKRECALTFDCGERAQKLIHTRRLLLLPRTRGCVRPTIVQPDSPFALPSWAGRSDHQMTNFHRRPAAPRINDSRRFSHPTLDLRPKLSLAFMEIHAKFGRSNDFPVGRSRPSSEAWKSRTRSVASREVSLRVSARFQHKDGKTPRHLFRLLRRSYSRTRLKS